MQGDKMAGEDGEKAKAKVLSITIKDKMILKAAYMPFLTHGGLFIPTTKTFAMGEKVSLLITLIDQQSKYSLTGKIVWITPVESQTNKAAGIGVEFSDDADGYMLRKRVEEILGPLLQSNDATHTM